MAFFNSRVRPEKKALELRQNLSLGLEPIDLEEVCSKLNIMLDEDDLGASGQIAGCLVWVDDQPGILVNKYINNDGRKRFTIGHEIGHFYIHEKKDYECKNNEIQFYSNDPQETEANRFASELLLPSSKAKEILKKKDLTLDLICETANQFDMSLTATAIKLVKESSYDSCAVILSQNGSAINVMTTKKFEKDWVLREKYLPIDERAVGRNKCHPAAWISGKRLNELDYILEEHLVLGRLEMVLSVISVPEIEEHEFDDEY